MTFSGHLDLTAALADDGSTYLASQSFRAPFHLSKPHWEGRALVVQVVNPTAGILEGDQLATRLHARKGASLLVSTPSATRVFTMRQGSAAAVQSATVSSGAWLEYAPEPLVPHKGSVFSQRTELEVEAGGSMLWCEGLMPGRLARGEAWSWTRLLLDLRVRVADQLVLRERFDESGESFRRLARLAGTGDGACFSNWVLVSPHLPKEGAWLESVAALQRPGLRVGASALRGELGAWNIRFIAADSILLRDGLAEARARLSAWLPGLQVIVRKL